MVSFTLGFRKVGSVEKRRDKRHMAPVFAIRLDGQQCETINWSLGGLLLRNHRGYVPKGRVVRVDISEKLAPSQRDALRLGRMQGPPTISVSCEVVHCQADKHQVAVKFIRLEQHLLHFLERQMIAYRRRT